MRSITLLALPALAAVALGAAWEPVRSSNSSKQFPHEKHMDLFPCSACHGGLTQSGGAPYPQPTFCAACHDGNIQVEIDWTPPEARPQSNPRFEHATHLELAGNECSDCHVVTGELPVAEQCRDCHSRSESLSNASVVHGTEFRNRHASDAAAAPENCASCHLRADCLDCHRPGAASGSPGYHPANFLSEHPTAAYSRSQSCSDCHNVRSYCAACHAQAGLTAAGAIGDGYHDAKQNFVLGHGQAARQSLESCVACHSQDDCLRCHSALTGRINPHGPGFDADDLRERTPSMCAVCHGSTIPGGG
jgi:hypothetical protein